MKKTELQYIFRKPKFPVIVSIEGYFIGAETPADFLEQLNRAPVNEKGIYDMVDVTGEGWSFSVEQTAISPITFKKRWTKKQIISLFNQRINKGAGQQELYSEKSISSKRLDRIIMDLVRLSSTLLYHTK